MQGRPWRNRLKYLLLHSIGNLAPDNNEFVLKFLLFASYAYAYPVLRPLEAELRRRGYECAWLLKPTCPDMLAPGEQRLAGYDEAIAYGPDAVLSPNIMVPDFLPGIKVMVFHGYPINKRSRKVDNHFRMRGWYDIFCTAGESSTPTFRMLEQKLGYFRVYETGWPKADAYFAPAVRRLCEERLRDTERVPTVLVASTFSRGITSMSEFLPEIERMASTRPWRWVITLHPKLRDPSVIEGCKRLAKEHENVVFKPVLDGVEDMARTDVMLCDSSSIIVEYMFLDKPVVTMRNATPGPHLLNVLSASDIEGALERALTRPEPLMEAMRAYSLRQEAHRDGHNAARVIDAVEDYQKRWQGRLPHKPLNLFRKLRLRWQLRRWYPIHF